VHIVCNNGQMFHERLRKFEELQRTTDEVLHRPRVQQKLGRLGTRLIELNQTAFLPNVSDRVVRVPRQYLDTDSVGILPYLYSDYDLKPHDTLLQPTPARRERLRLALGRMGLANSEQALEEFIHSAIDQMSNEERSALVNPVYNAGGGAVSHYDANTGLLVASRSLVVPRWQDLSEPGVVKGGVVAHELVHAVDVNELMSEPNIYYHARTELRGYGVGAIIAEDAIERGEMTRQQYESDDNITAEVEEARQEYGIDADVLLNGDFQFTDENENVTLYLLLMGVIR
jgi:hypothetical protein